jgi:transposase-like protein
VLGARAPAREALRVVARLLDEGYRRADIARGLGHQPNRPWPELAIARQGAAVTWRTVYRLRAFLRRVDRLEA